MVKKYSFIGAFSLLIIILQQAIFSSITISGAGVDIVFVYVICIALLRDEIECIIVALFCGIIIDSFFPSLFGVNTVTYLSIGYLLSQIEKKIYKDAIIIPILLTIGLSVVKALLSYGYFYISSINFDLYGIYMKILVLQPLYNSVVCIFMYKLVKKISKLKIMQEEWKF